MRTILVTAMAVAIAVEPVCAQTAIGVGTGVANSRSSSSAGALAIGGGNATGGNARGGNSQAAIVQNTNVPASQSITNVPTTFAPGLSAAGIETCLGSVSGGGSWLGTGISLGGTIPDPGCATRLDARTLWSMGLKKAAVARLCLNSDIYRSMPDVCYRYLPVSSAPAPYVVAPIGPSPVGEFASRDIWLIDGKTGKDRLCNDYDSSRQRCLKWDGAVTLHYAAKKTRPVHSVGTTPPAASLVVSTNEDHSK